MFFPKCKRLVFAPTKKTGKIVDFNILILTFLDGREEDML
jgi:hypothetical protein